MNITESLLGSKSAKTTSKMSLNNPSIGIVLTSSSALLTSLAILITNGYISTFKLRYTKLRNWVNVIILLYEKTLKTSMVDKKLEEKEALELKQVCNQYMDKRKEFMKIASFRVDVFGDVISEDSISPAQITKLNISLAKLA